MNIARMLIGAAVALISFDFPSHHSRASYPVAKRKANPVKRAARKRQRKAHQINRGVR